MITMRINLKILMKKNITNLKKDKRKKHLLSRFWFNIVLADLTKEHLSNCARSFIPISRMKI